MLVLGDNFSYQGAKPLDARLKYDTLANMKAVADATMYEGCLGYCEATGKTYQWKSTNTVDADTGKWREFETGGASALSELTDTNISTPTDGQVLQYDGTNDEWVNGDIEAGGVVQGYAYAQTGSGLDSILEALNQEIGTQYNVEVIKSWTGYEAYDNPTSFVFLYDDTNKTASLMIANNSVALYHASNGYAWYCAAKLTDSSDSATAIKSSSAINVANNVATVSDITEFTLTNNYETWGRQAEIITMAYVAGSVDMTEFGEDSRVHYTELDVTPIHGELQFYSDSAHTQLITPSTGKMYYDIATHTTYIWDGTQYVQTSGGSGTSALEDLTDTNISTPSNGQVLAYNGTSEKWENSEPIGDGNLIQGYYSEGSSISTPQEFLDAVNSQLSGTEITLSPSTLADGINGVFYVVIVNETTARFALGTVENKDAKLTYADNRACAYSRTISNSTSISFLGDTRTLTTKVTNPQETVSFYPLSFLDDSNKEALFFVSDNINITVNDYPYATTVIPLSILSGFYLDSAKTQMVAPDVHCIYEDIPTGSLYIWDGSAYIQTSGGAGASSVEDLTDTEIDTETLADGQILQYNGDDEKWENAELPEVDTTKLYSTEDTTSTALEDADTIPFCDVSISEKRQSTWTNIKSTLKTYFDTLYSTVKTKGTPASGGTDLSLVTTGDMYDWNNKANTPTIIAETIAVGSTSVTFSNVPTSGNYLITPFFSVVGLEYDSISQSGSTVTVTFPTQSSIAYAYLKIESV